MMWYLKIKFGELEQTKQSELRLFNDIEINNTTVFAEPIRPIIPESEEITFIINKATNIWGAFRYKSENDVLRFKVPISKTEESLQAFSITF